MGYLYTSSHDLDNDIALNGKSQFILARSVVHFSTMSKPNFTDLKICR